MPDPESYLAGRAAATLEAFDGILTVRWDFGGLDQRHGTISCPARTCRIFDSENDVVQVTFRRPGRRSHRAIRNDGERRTEAAPHPSLSAVRGVDVWR